MGGAIVRQWWGTSVGGTGVDNIVFGGSFVGGLDESGEDIGGECVGVQ